MPSSSLAAALAASKIGGQAATTVDTSVKNEDEHHPSSPSSPRRPSSSSLRRHNQANKDGAKRDERETSTIVGPLRGKMKKHDVIITSSNNNDHKKKNGDESKDPPLIQREKTSTTTDKMNINPADGGGGCSKSTTKRGKKKGAEVSTPAKNDDGIILSTGQIPVFVCDIPGDGDGDADDGDCKDATVDDHDGGRLAKSATKRRRGRKNNKDKAPPTSPPVIEIADISPSEIVFVCDVPSDGDDDYDDDGDGEYLDGGDGSVDDDNGGGDGADEGGECGESVVDGLDRNVVVTSDGRQNNTTARSRGNGDRGGGGGGRSGRVDRTASQGPQFAVLGGTGGDRGAIVRGAPPPGRGNNAKCGGNNNVRRGNDEYSLGDGGGKDRRIIPNLPVNTGAMPTPWSMRAQEATKNINDVGIGKRGGGGGGARSGGMNLRSGNATTAKVDGSGGRRNTAYPPANSRAEAMKNSDARDESTRKQSRDNDARAGLRPRGDHRPIGGMTSSSRERISSRAPHQPNPTIASSANAVIESGYVKEPSPVSSAAIKLESTAIKGRWADEDSDNE